jgi:hypothetical protein
VDSPELFESAKAPLDTISLLVKLLVMRGNESLITDR